MSDSNPDIKRLDDAITSLNDDAESMHSLITRSTDELENATAEAKRTADLAERALNALDPLREQLDAATKETQELVSSTSETIEKLTDTVTEEQKAQREAFESFASDSLKAAEKTRDELQTDLLSHKTATAARLDSLESTVNKRMDALEGAISSLSEEAKASLNDQLGSLQKKVALPLYGVIAVALLQLITLAMLLLR